MNFGDRLVFLRKAQNYTQTQIAQALGIAKSTYCGYEVNNRKPNIEKIVKLAQFFNVTTNFILGIGIFNDWDLIEGNLEEIVIALKEYYKGIWIFDDIENENIIFFINILDAVIEKIDIGEKIKIYPKITNKNLSTYDKLKSTSSTKSSENDAKKEQLIKNYVLLNDDGKEDLLDYSNMLASNPRKIKGSDSTVQK